MSTTLHSFMDIFETTIEDGDTSVQLNKIVIPLIQRDYGVMWEEVGIDPGLPFEEKVKFYHMQMLP